MAGAVSATTITINSADELRAFATNVTDGKTMYLGTIIAGSTIELAADIDLSDSEWTPINASNQRLDGCTIDGKGHTISNMRFTGLGPYASSSSGQPANYYVGFISYFAANTGLTIQNITFKDAYSHQQNPMEMVE